MMAESPEKVVAMESRENHIAESIEDSGLREIEKDQTIRSPEGLPDGGILRTELRIESPKSIFCPRNYEGNPHARPFF
jgi:hypothetical protein